MFFFPHLLIECCPHKTCPETVTIYFLLIGAYECQPADYLIMLKTPTVYSSCCFFSFKSLSYENEIRLSILTPVCYF